MLKFFTILLLLFCSSSFADNFLSNASYKVCFSPGGGCTAKIIAAEENNTENVLIIDDKSLAQKYVKNWYERERQSIKNLRKI